MRGWTAEWAAGLLIVIQTSRDKTQGGMEGVSHPQPLKTLSLCRAKMVVKCTSARQFTGQRVIGELLLLTKVIGKNVSQGYL